MNQRAIELLNLLENQLKARPLHLRGEALQHHVALLISPNIQPDTISWETAHQCADRVIKFFIGEPKPFNIDDINPYEVQHS